MVGGLPIFLTLEKIFSDEESEHTWRGKMLSESGIMLVSYLKDESCGVTFLTSQETLSFTD